MDKKDFTIEYLFTLHKDKPCSNELLKTLADKYKLGEQDITELRAKWVKYQVEYYGEQIKPSGIDIIYDMKRVSQNAYKRKSYKKNGR